MLCSYYKVHLVIVNLLFKNIYLNLDAFISIKKHKSLLLCLLQQMWYNLTYRQKLRIGCENYAKR